MSTVLDDAETRIAPVTATAHTLQQERRNSMYEEIGRQNRAQAPANLAEVEACIGKEISPFVAQVESIGRRAKQSLPQRIQAHLTEMVTLCTTVPNTIRAGIDTWDRLTPPIGPDGRNLDPNERARLIYNIRAWLRNGDGVPSRLRKLKTCIENYIRESGWPASQPSAAA